MTYQGTKTAIVVVAVGLALGCLETGEEDPGLWVQHQAISACGGFEQTLPPESGGTDDYCAAEVLDWAYDPETEVLELTDARALLNCCGERTMRMSLVDDVYVISETDAAEGGMGRCDCMCVFDLRLTVEGLAGGVLPVRVERLVTDEASVPAVLWEGELDLGTGAGSVVLDGTDVGMWCSEGA